MKCMLTIEVAYANPKNQSLITLKLLPGATVLDAIQQSGILAKFPEIDLKKNQVGVFGERISLTQILKDRDRVEIYRPLQIDPKQARLNRVKKI